MGWIPERGVPQRPQGRAAGRVDRCEACGALAVWTSPGRGIVLPDHTHAVGGDPLTLLADQALLAFGDEELIEARAGLVEPGRLKLENGADLTLPLHPLLVGARQAKQAHTGDGNKAELDGESDDAAEQLTAFTGEADPLSIP